MHIFSTHIAEKSELYITKKIYIYKSFCLDCEEEPESMKYYNRKDSRSEVEENK